MEVVAQLVEIRCPRCDTTKSSNEFYKNRSRPNGHGIYCKLCERLVSGPYQKSDEGLAKARARARRRRENVLELLGGKCVCCNEDTYEFLQFDHINNDGAEHRKELGRSNLNTADVLRRITEFQILCANCNFAKGMYGTCPHEGSR